MADSGGGLGGSGSVLGGPLASSSGVSSSGPIWEQIPYLSVVVDGVELNMHAIGATIDMGLDVITATATVDFTEDDVSLFNSMPQNADVVINCGTGPHNINRFHGKVKRKRANLWPHTFSLICRGQLSQADQFKQSFGAGLPSFFVQAVNSRWPIVGIQMADILAGKDPTDQNYVLGVLNLVPGLEGVDPSDIGGTGHIFGAYAYRELMWAPYVSALSQAQKLDEVSLGYRLFEGLNGRILRTQVFGYPTNNSDTTFTEGIDVWSATGDRSIEELMNAEYVEGYIFGGLPGIIGAYENSSNDFQSSDNPFVDTFSSPLIEDLDFATQVAQWRLGERNRELVDVTLTTFRDDQLYPGRTISVILPHAGLTEPVWIQHVTIEIRADPILFQQTVRGLGGGASAGGNGVGNYGAINIG